MWRLKKIHYYNELMNTKQILNSINQLRDTAEKRGFDIMYKTWANEFSITFTVNEDKAKIYYKEKEEKVQAFRDRRKAYYDKHHKPKPKIKLVRKKI